jgi:hypothetical protein
MKIGLGAIWIAAWLSQNNIIGVATLYFKTDFLKKVS